MAILCEDSIVKRLLVKNNFSLWTKQLLFVISRLYLTMRVFCPCFILVKVCVSTDSYSWWISMGEESLRAVEGIVISMFCHLNHTQMMNNNRSENVITFLWWIWILIAWVYLISRSWPWCRRFLHEASWTSEESLYSRHAGHYEWLHPHPPYPDQECSLLSCAIMDKSLNNKKKKISYTKRQNNTNSPECKTDLNVTSVFCHLGFLGKRLYSATSGTPHLAFFMTSRVLSSRFPVTSSLKKDCMARIFSVITSEDLDFPSRPGCRP